MGIKIKALILASLLLSAFASGWMANGWRLGEKMAEFQQELAEAEAKQAAAVLSIERLSQEASQAISEKEQAQQRAANTKAKVIYKKVIEYVQDPNTGHCELPDAWVLAHDQAAGMPRASEASSEPDQASLASPTDREALVAVTANYEACQANIIQLNGLIEWANSLSDVKIE